jgi:hypothetical protein
MYMPERFDKTPRPTISGTWRVQSARGVAVVVACMLVAACSGLDRQKFEKTSRAATALSVATDRGVNASRYRELVASFEAQLSVVRRRVTEPDERDLVDQYDEALKAYRAALAVWTLKNQSQSEWVYSGPTTDELLKPYDIQFGEGMSGSGLKRASADAVMKEIWRIAKAKLEVANTTLNGKKRP